MQASSHNVRSASVLMAVLSACLGVAVLEAYFPDVAPLDHLRSACSRIGLMAA